MTRLLALLTFLLALASPSWAQDPSASAKLYARSEGGDLQVAIKVTPDFDCYFYDDGEAGDVGGMPTRVTLSGVEGAAWSDVWFPEAHVKASEYEGLGPSLIFEGKTLLYAVAKGGGDLDPSGLVAEIDGQVCNQLSCVPWEVTLKRPGKGTDAVWGGFPAALLAGAPSEAPSKAPSSDEPRGDAEEGDAAEAPTWAPIFAENEVAKARWFGRVDGDDVAEIVVEVATPEGWHMYGGPDEDDKGPGIATPTVITVEGGGVEWEEVHYPRPEHYVPKGSSAEQFVWIYEGTFHFGVKGDALEGFEPEEVTVTIDGQSCDVNGCMPIDAMAVPYEGEGNDALYAAAFATWTLPEIPEPAAGGGESKEGPAGETTADAAPKVFGQGTESEGGLLGFILLAIGAGLITLLMPCTYPMIPITLSFFTKQADARGGNVLPLALIYGAGIISIFVAIGVLVGPAIAAFAGHYITNLVIGALFLVFAGALFGMFELRPPAFLMQTAGSATQKGGYTGVFLMGLTLVITSFTCTAPFVGSLLAAGGGGFLKIAIGMFFFGLTMATPFVFLALVPGRLAKIPSAGAWMNTLKVFMGFVELAASLKFFSNADIAENWMLLPREVFLVLWAGIFFVAGMYLLGKINLKGESADGNIGPARMLGGLGNILFGLYCLLGTVGYQLDGFIMGAMAPPPTYSRGLVITHQGTGGGGGAVYPEGIEALEGGPVAEDDYDVALDFAREKNLGLLLNFTAHT